MVGCYIKVNLVDPVDLYWPKDTDDSLIGMFDVFANVFVNILPPASSSSFGRF